MKAFFAAAAALGLGVPEADEEVGGEADDLPAHEEQQEAVGDDDAQHGSGEEREEAEEAGEVLVVLHVADAVDEDQQADEGDHDQHDGGEGVEHPAELEPLVAELEPGEVEDSGAGRRAEREAWAKAQSGEQERDGHGADGERGGEHAAALLGEGDDAGGEDGQRGNQPEVLNDPGHESQDRYGLVAR